MGRSAVLAGGFALVVLGAAGIRPTRPAPPSPAQTVGDLIYIPATMGTLSSGELAHGVEVQVRHALQNITAALAEHGVGLDHVVRANVYLTDIRDFQAMNSVYRTFFPQNPPTRATVQADLPRTGARVQIAVVAAARGIEVEEIRPAGLVVPQLPYSWGKKVGNTLFVAGATSRDPQTFAPVAGSITEQTLQIFRNIGEVLSAAGMNYGDVVRCRVYLNDARDFRDMNSAYGTVFTEAHPARATVRARLANPTFLTEIMCLAVQHDSRRVVIAEGARASRSPFSPAIGVAGRLYLAGMVGGGRDARGDVQAQARIALRSLENTMKAAELGFENVVEAVIWVADVRHAERVLEVYEEVMPDGAPTPTTIGMQLAGPDLLVEIMMTAAR